MERRTFTGDALLAGGQVARATLVFEGTRLAEVREPVAGERALDGLMVPGLINAHTHLEQSHVGLVPGGEGLPAWVRRLFAQRAGRGDDDRQRDAEIAAQAMAAAGTAAVCDVAGGESTAPMLVEAGLGGVVQRERLGQDSARTRLGMDEAPGLHAVVRRDGCVPVFERPTAHAPYSTHPDLAQALLAPGASPVAATVHLAEDPAERQFLQTGEGAFAELLDAVGVQWSLKETFGGPVDWLRRTCGLGPHVAAVHGVDLRPPECQALADHHVGLVLCARSNLHIGGRAPALPELLLRGARLALGTDGLVSCPDLDVLGEIPVLHELVPEVDGATWLHLATAGGADVLRLPGLGRLTEGVAPGLVLLDTDVDGVLKRAPRRRWLVQPGAPAEEAA